MVVYGSQGIKGWSDLLKTRAEVFPYLKEKLIAFATAHGERVLTTPRNPVPLHWHLSPLAGLCRVCCCVLGLRFVFFSHVFLVVCCPGVRYHWR